MAALPDADGALVLGCDSVFEFDGEPYGKPHEPEIARERLRRMSGRHGVLHTGHWLVDCRATAFDATALDAEDASQARRRIGATVGAVASAAVHFIQLSDAEIDAYVASGEPLHVAGSFTIDWLRRCLHRAGRRRPACRRRAVRLHPARAAGQRQRGHESTDLWD